MKTVYRWLASLALLSALLTGCVSAPVPLVPSSEPMSVRSAVGLMSKAVLTTDDAYWNQSGLRVYATGLSLSVTVNSATHNMTCQYAATPAPLFLDWIVPALVVNCQLDNETTTRSFLMLSLGSKKDRIAPPTFARAWQVMLALAAPETPEERAAFVAALAGFRAGKAGPSVGETVRPHKVAAELAVKDKRLWDAADEFAQGLALAPWWPQGNFNLALVYGELRAYPLAARYMQRYLELVPDASNARAAQDKVYEWTAAQRAGG